MPLLLLDNYDSFTYNLHHLLEPEVDTVDVLRNDEIDLDEVEGYDRIVLSPGPGLPSEAGSQPELIRRFARTKPILGVCLGMQALAEYFGTPLLNMEEVQHGRSSAVSFKEDLPLFLGIDAPMTVGLYHSWRVDHDKLSSQWDGWAFNDLGHLMAMGHRTYPLIGIQFHPESVLTPAGGTLIRNWIRMTS